MESTETTPLCVFVAKARASNRLLYGDLRRLQRDVLPAGASSREEVEALLSLDWIERVDKEWPGYLARVVTDFVLSTSNPSSDALDAETAAWLVSLLAHLKPKTAAVVLRSLSVEAFHPTIPAATFSGSSGLGTPRTGSLRSAKNHARCG